MTWDDEEGVTVTGTSSSANMGREGGKTRGATEFSEVRVKSWRLLPGIRAGKGIYKKKLLKAVADEEEEELKLDWDTIL